MKLSAVTMLGVCLVTNAWSAAPTMDDLFRGDELNEIRLTTADPAAWNQLREHYLEDTYYPVAFEWRGIKMNGVGIRSRGNGSRSGVKPGLKVDFNRYKSSQEFVGLKSIVLDNLMQDPSMLRERIAMGLFRRAGVPAPRVAHTKLYVNGEYVGLYAIVESVDKGFLKRELAENDGWLYDYEWDREYWFDWRGDDPSAYVPAPFQLETNTSKPNPRPLVEMIRTVSEATDEEFADAITRFIDPKAFLKYLAIETYLAEADGLAGEWGMNNFYLYGRESSDRFVFIPWDKDVTFQETDRSIWRNTERNSLIRRVLAVPEWNEVYMEALAHASELSGKLGGWMEHEVEAAASQIRSAAADDPNKPFTYSQFEESIAHLHYFGYERDKAVEAEILSGH